MGFVIRPATEVDIPALLALQAACFPPDLHDDESDLRAMLRDAVYLVACAPGIAGAAIGMAGDAFHVYAVEVHPEHRGQGIGAALVAALLEYADARSVTADAVSADGARLLARVRSGATRACPCASW